MPTYGTRTSTRRCGQSSAAPGGGLYRTGGCSASPRREPRHTWPRRRSRTAPRLSPPTWAARAAASWWPSATRSSTPLWIPGSPAGGMKMRAGASPCAVCTARRGAARGRWPTCTTHRRLAGSVALGARRASPCTAVTPRPSRTPSTCASYLRRPRMLTAEINRPCTIIRNTNEGGVDELGNDVPSQEATDTVCELQQRVREEGDYSQTSETEWLV